MELNDSVVFDQLKEHWQKMLVLVLWKLKGMDQPVEITMADMLAFAAADTVLLTHGHKDSIEFRLVTNERAKALADWDAKQRGKA